MTNQNSLYLEMISGVAGDMLNAALLDLSGNPEGDREWLIKELSHLLKDSKEKISLAMTRVKPGGLYSLQIEYHTPEDDWFTPKHDHHNHHHVPHRRFAEIESLLRASSFSAAVISRSIAAFEVLAKAEGAVHGIDYRKVHFHEVGSLDAILEVCGFFLLIEKLGINEIHSTPLVFGTGTVKCAHGLMPVPVPAVARMAADHCISYKKIPWETGELTTPTGLAILIGSGCRFESFREDGAKPKAGPPPTAIGYGAGHKVIPGLVNIIRANLFQTDNQVSSPSLVISEEVFEIKVNLDDMNGEEVAGLVEEIYSAGALDVCQYPVYMKKGRLGVVLEILVREKERSLIGQLLLKKSSTIGYRYRMINREILPRKNLTIDFQGFSFLIKEVTLPDGHTRIKIEDESLREGMRSLALSRKELIKIITELYEKGDRTSSANV